jgi:hypothetical protein
MYAVQPKLKYYFSKPRNSFLKFPNSNVVAFDEFFKHIFLTNFVTFTAHRLLVFAPITTKFNPKFHTSQ